MRTIAVREDQTLDQLHEALRLAFGWFDPHLYSFWTGAKWWDQTVARYEPPFELDPDDEKVRSSRVPLSELGLRKGRTMAYVFDFGDEWRLLLKVVDRWTASEEETYPMLVEAEGTPPSQYAPSDGPT